MNEYKIISALRIRDCTIIALDRDRAVEDMNKSNIIIDGVSYAISLTHKDNNIIVHTLANINGKRTCFV